MVGPNSAYDCQRWWPKVGLRLPISVILSENTPLTTIDPLPPEQKVSHSRRVSPLVSLSCLPDCLVRDQGVAQVVHDHNAFSFNNSISHGC